MWMWMCLWQIISLTFFAQVMEIVTEPVSVMLLAIAVAIGCTIAYPLFVKLNLSGRYLFVVLSWLVLAGCAIVTALIGTFGQFDLTTHYGTQAFAAFGRMTLFTAVLDASLTLILGARSHRTMLQKETADRMTTSREDINQLHSMTERNVQVVRQRVAGPLFDLLFSVSQTQKQTSMRALAAEFHLLADTVRKVSTGLSSTVLSRPTVPTPPVKTETTQRIRRRGFIVIYALVTPLAPFMWDNGWIGLLAGVSDVAAASLVALFAMPRAMHPKGTTSVVVAGFAALTGSVLAEVIMFELPNLGLRLILSNFGFLVGLLLGGSLLRIEKILADVRRADKELAWTTAELAYAEDLARYRISTTNTHVSRLLHSSVQGKLAAAAAACMQAATGQHIESDARAMCERALSAILYQDIPAIEQSLDLQTAALRDPWVTFRARWEAFVQLELPENLSGIATNERLFAVLDEVITNAIRHGQSSRVCVHLKQVDQTLWLKVENNGLPHHGSPRSGAGSKLYSELTDGLWGLENTATGVEFTATIPLT
jgi:hypothetical protein